MTVSFSGINSVADRTIFTHRGPIVKKPISLGSGSDLRVLSETDISIPSASFVQSDVGKSIVISGSPNGRNNGTFTIQAVLSATRVRLSSANLSILDVSSTTTALVNLSNDIRRAYNAHVLSQSHNFTDMSELVTAQVSVDSTSAVILLNQIRSKVMLHLTSVSGVHETPDTVNVVTAPIATNLSSAILLANSLRRVFEAHRQERLPHVKPDSTNRVFVSEVVAVTGTFPSPLVGPLSWVFQNPRIGQIADEPSDVTVTVNGSPATVEAVYGLLGAVVLQTKPTSGSSVLIDYAWLDDPPTQIERLNSSEFALNQVGNKGVAGLPSHKYRSRSTLLTPKSPGTVRSSTQPKKIGWKYKGIERAYTASLNDPNTLLLNVPANRVSFQGLRPNVKESVVRYDPTTLPNQSTDPWELNGISSGLSLPPGDSALRIDHTGSSLGTTNLPPFFSHPIDLSQTSIMSAAFRSKVDSYSLDGDFTGVCFGFSDGPRATVVGFLETDANNLSSSIVLANRLKSLFNKHIVEDAIHVAPDAGDAISIVDATDLASLIILSNSLLLNYNKHINKILSDSVHTGLDTPNLLDSLESSDLAESILILNEMTLKFNDHLVSSVHVNSDLLNSAARVKQVGILTNRGYPEDQESWDTYASDWSEYRTYRIFRDTTGDVSLFFSGFSDPAIETSMLDLPPLSSIDAKFDEAQQTFFGTIGKESSSVSLWSFVRVNTNPFLSGQDSFNKSVVYVPTTTPELDASYPWIVAGSGGIDRIKSSNLIIDSTSSAPSTNVPALGLSTGPYRGFIRLEPLLNSRVTCSLEFTGKVGYYTFSVNNLASGVFIDDNEFSTHVVFLQANPNPAEVVGQIIEPFAVSEDDVISVSVNDGPVETVVFGSPVTTVSGLAAAFSAYGIDLSVTSASGAAKFQTLTSGSSSKINFVGGNALPKIGVSTGITFGSDSKPEPKLSWFGEERPNLDYPTWSVYGSQDVSMFGRVMRLSDESSSDFVNFGINNTLTTTPVFSSSTDWKVDFRLSAVSFTPGASLSGLRFCGALLKVDEGPSGKNLEVHLTNDASGNPFVHVVSLDSTTNTYVSVSQIPCGWDDNEQKTFNVFTSKGSLSVILMVDGALLGTVPYTSLKTGVSGPSIYFGSGSTAAANLDLRSSQSVFDWESVCIFKDSKISDPNAYLNRFIGLYIGGDPGKLSSYKLAQVDWTNTHTYKIVRDPGTNVSVYIDNSPTPSMSVIYDMLSLPPVSSSFLQKISRGKPLIAFGSFNSSEIDRTYWSSVKYSIGKITQTNGIVPSHQELNQGNAVVSPDHLRSNVPHNHYGFNVYSGGTPTDDFLGDPTVAAFTQLGESTAPVPMTQDLESRGGLTTSLVPVTGIGFDNIVNQRGFLSDFSDDDINATTLSASSPSQSLIELCAKINELYTLYNTHRVRVGGTAIHQVADNFNVATSLSATDLSTALLRLNQLVSVFNAHRVYSSHYHSDLYNTVSSTPATDLSTAVTLASALSDAFKRHQSEGVIHTDNDTFNSVVSTPTSSHFPSLVWTCSLLIAVKTALNAHFISPGVHLTNDVFNTIVSADPTDLSTAVTIANEIRTKYGSHILNSQAPFHLIGDGSSVIQSPTVTGYTSLMVFVNELAQKFPQHAVKPIPIHSSPDTTNSVLPGPGPIKSLLDRMTDFRSSLSKHRTYTVIGPIEYMFHKYPGQYNGDPIFPTYDESTQYFDYDSIYRSINSLQADFEQHVISSAHEVSRNVIPGTKPPATTIMTAFELFEELSSRFNAHISGYSWHVLPPGQSLDTQSAPLPEDPLSSTILAANELRTKFNSHVLRKESHHKIDETNLVLVPEATTLPTLITLTNSLLKNFNAHLVSGSHIIDDSVNDVSGSDAIDLQSASDLISLLSLAFNAHRTESGVHGSSVYIRLDAPDRVLYRNMSFFKVETGTLGLVAPFSESLRMEDGFTNQNYQYMSYPGGEIPEQAVLSGLVQNPFSIINGDTLIVSIDFSDPITITFGPGDTTASNVATKINSTLGIPPGFAFATPGGTVRLTSIISTPNSDIKILGGTAAKKLGLDKAQSVVWQLLSDDLGAVQVQTLNAGPVDFLRLNTTESDNNVLYRAKTGLTDSVSMDFEATFTIRVNAAGISDGDTGVNVGISGIAGPGFTAAFGFDVVYGSRYVKLVDLNNGNILFRRLFEWGDGAFHTYRITRKSDTQTLDISILS